ncbi:MAG: hypothetical protein U0L11_06735 [Acutalibacteraceae bacterium]|nr:hypothetical protein [Acutalibacteraceae bacterium]
MSKLKEYFMCFSLGAVMYGLIEVIVRGYTHWTMILTGGAVMVLIHLINRTKNLSLLTKCLLGATVITSLEFSVGMIVNVALGWNVWDYTDKPFNIFGQICPQFCLAWFFLSIPAFAISRYVEKRIRYY